MATNIVVPEVGESIVDARVARWLKKEGDSVSVGDALVELETDKIDLEVAAPQGGVLSKIAQGDGADVKVGEVLGIIEEDGTADPERRKPEDGSRKLEAGSGQPEADKTRARRERRAANPRSRPPGTATPAVIRESVA
jgi:2-oxoglutarate dehydrogenase E2 component (dihydrolipoamide succinyltransferase)